MAQSYSFKLTSTSLSDLGLKRKNNEDSTLVLPECRVFAVADGMGGADAGEVASDMAVKAIADALCAARDAGNGTVIQTSRIVSKALRDANTRILRFAKEQNLRSCGTTVVVLLIDSRGAGRGVVLHAGDSRAYRLRTGVLEQITRDHSFAEASGITDVKQLPPRLQGVITRAVGIAPNVGIEETPVSVADGDLFLLCSDGLSSMVGNFKIQEILRQGEVLTLEQAARMLIDEANKCGGNDNISVVLVRVSMFAGELSDSPASACAETAMPGLPGAGTQTHTVAPPRARRAKTLSAGPDQLFEPGQETAGPGFSTVVRLGLGLVAILLLILVLLTVADRRKAVHDSAGRDAGKAADPALLAGLERPETGRVPAMFGEDAGEGAETVDPATNENGAAGKLGDDDIGNAGGAARPGGAREQLPEIYDPAIDADGPAVE
ncbi:MAG: protein phosphatase 2C domain-containing protein [bacterium]